MSAQLCIDVRERKCIELCLEASIEHTVAQLDLGDFHITSPDGVVIIERKTVPDLLSSVKDNRYKEQKMRLLQQKALGKKVLYVIEGQIDMLDQTLLGCCINMMIGDDISIMFTKDVPDTMAFVEHVKSRIQSKPARYFVPRSITSDDYVSASICPRKKDNCTKESVLLNQLCSVPGISTKKGKAIMQYCDAHSMNDMIEFLKGAGDLTKCEGIGKKLCSNIKDFLI